MDVTQTDTIIHDHHIERIYEDGTSKKVVYEKGKEKDCE